ncbi:uncharacterized protein UV8b_00230 [Ustilaginoidea virens]|uniref:Uncharacterized protein n=1 Tax=Ustilaginoidea virens TaxID=1159556 RepID=A0A8E5HJB8_USTVR|nr:uncharacterized protein UV8b_00230 [Ustilaginoidea virens]QUC15989.1 hypothetical protein UV8b_00230 [Ustilaginoidea virens]
MALAKTVATPGHGTQVSRLSMFRPRCGIASCPPPQATVSRALRPRAVLPPIPADNTLVQLTMESWSLDTWARPDTTLRRVVWSDPAASGLKTPSEKSPTHASRPDLERAAMASLAAPHNLKMCLPSVSSVPVAAASSFDPTSRSASRPRLLLSPNDRGLQTPRSGAASAECVLAPDQRLLLPELVRNVCDTTRTESVAEGKMPKRLASPLLKGKRLHQHLQHSRTRARQIVYDLTTQREPDQRGFHYPDLPPLSTVVYLLSIARSTPSPDPLSRLLDLRAACRVLTLSHEISRVGQRKRP